MILNIKAAARSQLPQLCEVCSTCLKGQDNMQIPLDESFFEKSLSDGLLTAVITCDKVVRGVCVCESSRIPDGCEISAIFIADEYQRKGFGKKLLSHALREMRSQHFKAAFLWLDERNTRAADFFKKIGFRHDGKKRRGNNLDFYELRYRIDI